MLRLCLACSRSGPSRVDLAWSTSPKCVLRPVMHRRAVCTELTDPTDQLQGTCKASGLRLRARCAGDCPPLFREPPDLAHELVAARRRLHLLLWRLGRQAGLQGGARARGLQRRASAVASAGRRTESPELQLADCTNGPRRPPGLSRPPHRSRRLTAPLTRWHSAPHPTHRQPSAASLTPAGLPR